MFLICAELGQLLFEKRGSADILQADGVEHAGGGFPQARRRVADHGFAGETFDDESTQLVEVDDIFELDAVAEGSAGRDDWVLQLDASEAYAEIEGDLPSLCPGEGVIAAAFRSGILPNSLTWMRRSERLGEHASYGVSGSVDAEQRGQRGGQINWLGVSAIGSRAEGQSVES